jgi:hypothetical protein
MDSLTVYIYKAETCTNILRYNTCMGSNKTIYLCLHPLPVPMGARISKYLNKYVRRGLCLIYISSFYFWSPPLPRKMRKTNVLYYPKLSHNGCTAAILTYPTMAYYFWLAPQVLWNDLRGIVIKQRHWQTFWGIVHLTSLKQD